MTETTTNEQEAPPQRRHPEHDGDFVRIEGVPPFDGEYDIEPGKLNGYDHQTVTRISRVRAGEFLEAFLVADYVFVIALAVVALQKARHPYAKDAERALMAAEGGRIQYVHNPYVDAAGDPVDPDGKPVDPPTPSADDG